MSEAKKTTWNDVALLVLLLNALLVMPAIGAYAAGSARATKAEQQKAIDAGVGRWVVDPQTGERSFVYGGK